MEGGDGGGGGALVKMVVKKAPTARWREPSLSLSLRGERAREREREREGGPEFSILQTQPAEWLHHVNPTQSGGKPRPL